MDCWRLTKTQRPFQNAAGKLWNERSEVATSSNFPTTAYGDFLKLFLKISFCSCAYMLCVCIFMRRLYVVVYFLYMYVFVNCVCVCCIISCARMCVFQCGRTASPSTGV